MTAGSKNDYMINTINTNTMKTKAILLITLLTLAFAGKSMAQAPDDCVITLSYFTEPAKAKNYEAALPFYEKLVKECPDYNLAIYQYAELMFKDFITKGDSTKVDDLIQSYQYRLQYFPSQTKEGEVLMDIAQLKFDNNIGTKAEQFAAFDAAFKKDPESFNSAKSLYTYFSLAVDLQSAGAKDIQEIFNLYDVVIEKIEKQENELAAKMTPLMEQQEAGKTLSPTDARFMEVAENNIGVYGTVKNSVNGKLGILADCPNLIPLYSKDFEAKKNDVNWVKNASARLSAKDCDDPLFFKLSQQLHVLEPSAKSAYYLGKLAEKEGNSSKALEYYNQAADLETNNADKARIYYSIAENFRKKRSYGTARQYYNRMLEVKPSAGIAYLKIAQMYAESANDCGNTVFEKRAVNWLAADMADKAARVDASLASSARSAASAYRLRAPQKTDIFSEGNAGKTITFNCWIGGSVKVPNL